ncbi:DNA glycosylase [Streptomyces sp. SID4948]|nr:DNA glycosylase [Streptomyces sp. SID4948]
MGDRRPSNHRGAVITSSTGPSLDDIVGDRLDVIFVGINPGLRSAVRGHSFSTPGNRMWPALHRSGFTPHQFRPEQERDLLDLGLGLTTLVRRATARASDLTREEYLRGAEDLLARMEILRPAWLAFLGVTGYRTAFGFRQARTGPQSATIAGAHVWIVPNPSGLNAHYPPAALAEEFTALRIAAGLPDRTQGPAGSDPGPADGR